MNWPGGASKFQESEQIKGFCQWSGGYLDPESKCCKRIRNSGGRGEERDQNFLVLNGIYSYGGENITDQVGY